MIYISSQNKQEIKNSTSNNKDVRVPGEIITTYGSPPDSTWALCDGTAALFDNTDEELSRNLDAAYVSNIVFGFDKKYYYRAITDSEEKGSTTYNFWQIYIYDNLVDCVNGTDNYLYVSDKLLYSRYSSGYIQSMLFAQGKMFIINNDNDIYSFNQYDNSSEYTLSTLDTFAIYTAYIYYIINPYTEDIIQIDCSGTYIILKFLDNAGEVLNTITTSCGNLRNSSATTVQCTINRDNYDILFNYHSGTKNYGKHLILIDKDQNVYVKADTATSTSYLCYVYFQNNLYIQYNSSNNTIKVVQINKNNAELTTTVNISNSPSSVKRGPGLLCSINSMQPQFYYYGVSNGNYYIYKINDEESATLVEEGDSVPSCYFSISLETYAPSYSYYLWSAQIGTLLGTNIINYDFKIWGNLTLKTTPILTPEDGSRTYIKALKSEID